MTQPEPPTHRWVLQLDDGGTIRRSAARRAKIVPPELIETALVTAMGQPSPCSSMLVFGLAADGRLVATDLSRCATRSRGERAAAVVWLSGAPRAHWRRVKVTTPEAGR